jgi:molybdopterin synthase catalytic subunit
VIEVRITREPIRADELARSVRRPGAGAVVTFEGITREVDSLDYDAYTEMATRKMTEIVEAAISKHGLEAAGAIHRVGSVPRSEPSVLVSAAAAHREQAFAGAREIIDRIKAEAPIWKKEIAGEEGRWVEGSPPELRY